MFNRKTLEFSRNIFELTRNWSSFDLIESRRGRDWEKFDKMSEEEKISYRYKELRNYKNKNSGQKEDDWDVDEDVDTFEDY